MTLRTKGEQRAYADGFEMGVECVRQYLPAEDKKKADCFISAVRNAVEIEDIKSEETYTYTYKERQSCIHTINMLRRLALNIHGVIDVVDNRNCNELIKLLEGGMDNICQEHYRQGLKDAAEKPEAVFDPD